MFHYLKSNYLSTPKCKGNTTVSVIDLSRNIFFQCQSHVISISKDFFLRSIEKRSIFSIRNCWFCSTISFKFNVRRLLWQILYPTFAFLFWWRQLLVKNGKKTKHLFFYLKNSNDCFCWNPTKVYFSQKKFWNLDFGIMPKNHRGHIFIRQDLFLKCLLQASAKKVLE